MIMSNYNPAMNPLVFGDYQSELPSIRQEELHTEEQQYWRLSSKRALPLDFNPEPAKKARASFEQHIKTCTDDDDLEKPKPQSARMLAMRASAQEEETQLGVNFIPTEWHVICGRAKCNFDHVGNRRLRVMIAANLQAYVEASTRSEKSKIIDAIVGQIRESVNNGGFVKKMPDGSWVEIGATMAREKVGHTFRDCMKPLKNKVSEDDKQEMWMQAQDSIFSSLQLSRPASPGTDSSRVHTAAGAPEALQVNQDAIFRSLLEQNEDNMMFSQAFNFEL